jgi:hypothetical protein
MQRCRGWMVDPGGRQIAGGHGDLSQSDISLGTMGLDRVLLDSPRMVCLVKVSGPAFCPGTPSTGARHLLVDLGQARQHQEQIHSCELTVAAPFQACASQAGAVRPVRGDWRRSDGGVAGVLHGGPPRCCWFSLLPAAEGPMPPNGGIAAPGYSEPGPLGLTASRGPCQFTRRWGLR